MTTVAANGIRVCGHYTLLGKLGEGGEAEVWRARDHARGKEVALKILRPQLAQRPGAWEALEREHGISARLDHPLILKIDPPVRDGDVIALPMELAPGGDLRRLCGVSYLEIVPVLIEIAQALRYAHAHGIVHRDLKAGNVLFDARGHVRLTDFSTSKSGASPFTASPQQLRGEPPSVADDVYGLGALAYELLSGHPPHYPHFDARHAPEEPVPPLRPAHLAPGRLVSLVMAMLAKRPGARPTSMAEVIESLDAALNDTLTFAYDEPPDALAAPVEPPRLGGGREGVGREGMGREPLGPLVPTPAAPVSAPASPATTAAAPIVRAAPPAPAPTAAPAPAAARAPAAAPAPAVAPEPVHPPMVAPLRGGPAVPELRAMLADVKIERVPNLMRLEPVRRARWPWVLAAAIAALVVAAYLLQQRSTVDGGAWMPSSLAQLHWLAPSQVVKAVRGVVDAPMRAIASSASAKLNRSPGESPTPGQAPSASDSGRLAPNAPPDAPSASSQARAAAPPKPGSAAPAAPTTGSGKVAARAAAGPAPGTTAYAYGTAPPPGARASAAGVVQRAAPPIARPIEGVRQLLADAREAERARDYSRAAQDYSQALALDPGDATARAGLQRANEAFGAGEYAGAVATGFAALGAGRLDDARAAFERARSLDRHGREAQQGLTRVTAALRARELAEARSRARTDLENRLQALVDDPQRLGSPAVRAEAVSLMNQADAERPSSAVLRSLTARLSILLPQYDKPVHLALISDNLTQVEIAQIGSFGTFARREIDLKPGRYTVIGTRSGYREVRRDVTVAPGDGIQTISVRCQQPI